MKLQLALDTQTLEQAIELLEQVHTKVDIVEAGTPFVLEYGMVGVRELKKRFTDVEVLCDAKIMDAGKFETENILRAGADWVTVMACTDDATIADCAAAAHRSGKKAMADLLCVADIPKRARELDAMGIDCIAIHTGVDQQAKGQTPLKDLECLKGVGTKAMTAVAGGISLKTLDDYMALRPDILIVGGGIGNSEDPAGTAAEFKRRIEAYK